ncbi:MAG: Ku protein [Proteobacteria bacterium]|nr:Ku protein [Pseudomonadota bacterium]
MAARPSWQGHLKLSLVTCPVALYTGTSASGDIHFNLLNPATMNRIKMVTTDPETGPIERSELVKGYQVEKDRYIIMTDEEIKSVRLESTKTINIERFVDADEIDRLYWNDPYFLVPNSDLGLEAFAVIREAMAKSNKIALGRVVMHTRERLVALEPRGKGILAYTLRTADEVKNPAEFFDPIKDVTPDPAMVEIATRIIQQQEGAFEPKEFRDRYEDALRELIASKQKGMAPKDVAEPSDTNVVDLMAALRASLGNSAPAPAKGKKAANDAGEKPPSKKEPKGRKRA